MVVIRLKEWRCSSGFITLDMLPQSLRMQASHVWIPSRVKPMTYKTDIFRCLACHSVLTTLDKNWLVQYCIWMENHFMVLAAWSAIGATPWGHHRWALVQFSDCRDMTFACCQDVKSNQTNNISTKVNPENILLTKLQIMISKYEYSCFGHVIAFKEVEHIIPRYIYIHVYR